MGVSGALRTPPGAAGATAGASGAERSLLDRAMPILFVGIWATGFLVARLVAPHADPLTFLSARYVLSAALFVLIAASAGATWPRTRRGWRDALAAGVLMQGIYLGGVFWATRHGMPAGIAALIAGLQPLLTALLAFPMLGERVGPRRWLGIWTPLKTSPTAVPARANSEAYRPAEATLEGFLEVSICIGFAGAVLVLLPTLGPMGGIGVPALLACFAAMAGMTLGTIWQKRTAARSDLRTNAAVQFIGAAAVTIPVALLTEEGQFDGSWQVWLGLLWSVLGLSVAAISLLLVLIKRGAVAGVASLFYLVPPVAAAFAFLLFGEQLGFVQVAGMVLAAVGVAVASRAS